MGWLSRRAMADQHPDFSTIQHLMRDMMGDTTADQWSYASAMQDYAQSPWVYKALKVWSDSIGPLPIRLRRADGTFSDSHALVDLLAHPNPQMTASELWAEWCTSMGLGGECGFEFVRGSSSGRFKEIHPRPPTAFAVRPDVTHRAYRAVAG